MKSFSVSFKVTLWYTVFMALLAVAVVCLLFSVSSSQISSNVQTHLKETVAQSFAHITYQEADSVLEFDGLMDRPGS